MPKPEPEDDEVLIRVHATSVNDYDWVMIRGRPQVYRLIFGLLAPRVRVLGPEVSGTIEAVGKGIERLRVGDSGYGDIKDTGFGGFAEYVCTKESTLSTMPSGMTFTEGAALPHAGMLALQGLVDVGRIRGGDRVLIDGAGGGVSTIGVQIAKQCGAEVTGVTRGPKLEALRSVGFDHVIDYERQDFTGGQERYDLILDTKTDRSPLRYLKVLNPGGRYVTVGGHVPRVMHALAMKPLIFALTDKAVGIVALQPNKDLDYVNDLFERSGLQFLIDGPHALADIPTAIQRFGDAHHIGKIVITVRE